MARGGEWLRVVVRVKPRQTVLMLLVMILSGCGFHQDKSVEQLTEQYSNEHSRFIELDDMRVHYRDEGQGLPLLLIHGSNASLHSWDGWADALADRYRVIRLDLPGHGLTGPHPRDQYSWQQMADFIDHFVSALGLERMVVVGNSMGGAVAWHYAVNHSSRVTSLVLIDSRGIPSDEPMPLIFRIYSVPVVNRLMAVMTPRWSIRQSLEDVYGNEQQVSEALVQQYFDLTLRAGNREATIKRLSRKVDYSLLPRLKTFSKPVLIMWGEEDDWILPKYAERFKAYLPQAELIMYPGLGHMPMEEDSLRTAQDLERFIVSSVPGSLRRD